MQAAVSARHGPPNEELAAINRANRQFYAQRSVLANSFLSDPLIAEATYRQYQDEFSRRQILNLSSIDRLRIDLPYEHTLFAVGMLKTEILARKARTSRHQSNRARNRRNKVGDTATPLSQMIEELALKYRDLAARELVPHFLSRLREEHCDPIEIPRKTGDIRKDRIEYDFERTKGSNSSEKHRKSITIGRFENIVSKIRRASRLSG
jgi:hypothetical protein